MIQFYKITLITMVITILTLIGQASLTHAQTNITVEIDEIILNNESLGMVIYSNDIGDIFNIYVPANETLVWNTTIIANNTITLSFNSVFSYGWKNITIRDVTGNIVIEKYFYVIDKETIWDEGGDNTEGLALALIALIFAGIALAHKDEKERIGIYIIFLAASLLTILAAVLVVNNTVGIETGMETLVFNLLMIFSLAMCLYGVWLAMDILRKSSQRKKDDSFGKDNPYKR